MELPANSVDHELVAKISAEEDALVAPETSANDGTLAPSSISATPMLEHQRSTVSPEDGVVDSSVKIQPVSSVDALTKSTAEAQESPIAKMHTGNDENTHQLAAPQPTDTVKSLPLRKNDTKETDNEQNEGVQDETLPTESSHGAAENVSPTCPSTNPDVTAPANTSNQPTRTTVTEKSSESVLNKSSMKEQETSVPESGHVTMKDAGEKNHTSGCEPIDETKDIVNDVKTETETKGDTLNSQTCDVTMMMESETFESTEDSAETKSEPYSSTNTHSTDAKGTTCGDTNTTRDKHETENTDTTMTEAESANILSTDADMSEMKSSSNETAKLDADTMGNTKIEEAVKSAAVLPNSTDQEHSDDIELKSAESATATKVESQPCEEKKDEFMHAEKVESEEEEQVETTLSQLMEMLTEVDTPGSTCAAGPASCLPSVPGLRVEGVGDIPLPISDAQAKLLASVSEQAPHGKGMETIVDKSVRNTLQVDPSKITIQNPAWVPSLKKLVHQAAESLGVSPSLVNAELYKLLLYEEGGFFKKHRDTEKAKGMFATLVVQLPSKFTGGSFVVSHGGECETFSLGAGGNAAYDCHFVCHYADCEHEIKKVESGYRLALIYSLCYSGPGMPSADDVVHNDLSRVLKGLPADESMFVIPLEHQYTTASLARLGAGALKGSDRAKQGAIEVASKRAFKTIIAEASRTDSESGGGSSYYGDFEVYDVEPGSIDLSNAYYSDGSDASDQLKWIEKQINFQSAEDGGMVLASSEDLEEDNGVGTWGEGESGSIEYTGNEGATRETTYSTYVMIVYSEETGFERMCASEFSSAVSNVMREESSVLLHRILSFIKVKNPSISDRDAVRLIEAMGLICIDEKEALSGFNTIVSALSGGLNGTPSHQLTDALISSLERFGWTRCSDSIKTFATKLVARTDLNMVDFIKRVDFLLRLQKAFDSQVLDRNIDDCIRSFDAMTKSSSTTSGHGGHGHSRGWSHNDSTQTEADVLVSLARHHPSTNTKDVVQACIARMRKQQNTHDKLIQRISVLQRLRAFYDSRDVHVWFHDVVMDFISIVNNLPPSSPAPTRYGGSSDVLSSNKADELFRMLFKFGTSNDIERVEDWAMKAQLGQLSKLESILDRLCSPASSTTYLDAAASSAFIQAVKSRTKTLKLADLHSRHQKLLVATQGGPLVFSWSMPQACTSNSALTAFLRSPRSGPTTIVVGGGINNARSLAGASRRSYSYRSSSSNCSSEQLKRGYSATIEATHATGQGASIRVTKTRALFDAQMKKYRDDMSELAKVTEDIRMLDGVVAGVAAAAGTTRPIINVDGGGVDSQPNPAKKRRVKAPIPSYAEIVEIE